MTRMKSFGAACRVAAWVAVAVAIMLPSAVAAPREPVAGVDKKWRRYQSPHYELFSRVDDDTSRELLHHVETLRASLLAVLHVKEVRPMNLTLVYFDDHAKFLHYAASLGLGEGVAAFYFSHPDRSYIVISAHADPDVTRQTIFHEYVHHLMASIGNNPALWFGEGMAELFSTIEEEKGQLVFGEPIAAHMFLLQQQTPTSLGALFNAGGPSLAPHTGVRVGMLYAESWALMHYFMCGDSGIPREKLDPFFRYVGQEGRRGDNGERRAIFEACTGQTYEQVADGLGTYIRKGRYSRYNLPLPQVAAARSYAVRPMPIEELRQQLIELDLRVNRSPQSKLTLMEAADRKPNDPHLQEVLGTAAVLENEPDLARERWEKAISLGSPNAAIFHELARLEYERWYENFDLLTFRMPDERSRYLRGLIARSIQRAPEQSDGYEMLAWIEATAETPSIESINLVQKNMGFVRHRSEVLLALALTRLRAKDYTTADEILQQLEAGVVSEQLKGQLTEVRRGLRRARGEISSEEAAAEEAQESDPMGAGLREVQKLAEAGENDAAMQRFEALVEGAKDQKDRNFLERRRPFVAWAARYGALLTSLKTKRPSQATREEIEALIESAPGELYRTEGQRLLKFVDQQLKE